jgi:hypothetical protein
MTATINPICNFIIPLSIYRIIAGEKLTSTGFRLWGFVLAGTKCYRLRFAALG